MNKEIIYFEVNNWFCGRDYPNTEKWKNWMHLQEEPWFQFRKEDWLKENELVVVETIVDMSVNFCVTAKKEWVEKNCPELLTEFSSFLRTDKKGRELPIGRFGTQFFSWKKENIGLHRIDDGDLLNGIEFISFLTELQCRIKNIDGISDQDKKDLLSLLDNEEMKFW